MALLAAKRRMECERPSLTRSVDAAFGFFEGSRRAPSALVQDVFLALGVIAEALDASPAVRRSIAATLVAIPDDARVPTSNVVDRLLDVRCALDAS
jgi:hypothetical protein